jgi:hypothetical protein
MIFFLPATNIFLHFVHKKLKHADTHHMKSRKKILCTATAILLSVASSGFALDLSRFQGFLSGDRRKAPEPAKTFTDLSVNATSANYRSLNADAYYVQSPAGQLVTLGNNQPQRDGERYLLPADTRVPGELRPLLTERLTPRQGLSANGGTGATLIPSPGVLEPGKTAFGVHVQMFDLYNVNETKYTDQDYFDTTVTAAWGTSDGLEVSVDKTFANQDRYDIDDPLYLNFKYQMPGNVTLGGSLAAESGYHSTWVAAGVPVAWVGAGVNFGESDYKFSYNGYRKFKRARFGGYNYDYNTAVGYADQFFFMIGGAVPLNDHLRFVYDFNGDKFSLGFRFNYQNVLYLNAAYVSDGDYENLPGAIAHKRSQNFVFGGTIAY